MPVNMTFEIDESAQEYAIDKLVPGNDNTLRLYNKRLTLYNQFSRFWKSRMEVAKKCHNFMRREIFTEGQRKKYLNVQDKWPIEPQEMKPVVNALTGEIISRIKSYIVTMEDPSPPENAAPPEVVNVILKWLENKLKLQRKREGALRNGLIDGYPQWLYFSKKRALGDGPESLDATLLPWERTLCSPFFQEEDGSDINHLMIITKRTKAELLSTFPDRKNALAQHEEAIRKDPGLLTSTLPFDNSWAAEDRSNVIFDMVTQGLINDETGLYTTVEELYSVKKVQTVYLGDGMDPVILPPEWEDWQVEEWRAGHPEYDTTHEQEVATLWYTVWSTNGFFWENKQHWFQKQQQGKPYAMLPAIPYIASMEDHIPTGVGEDMLPYILLIATCATEGLSQVRKGTGRTTFVEEGAVLHPKMLSFELSAEEGIVLMKKGAVREGAFKQEMRKPNDTFFSMEDRYRQMLRITHNVNESIMGQSAPRQSEVAKQREILQGMRSQSPYVLNYQHFNYNICQLLCYMMPYFLTEHQLFEIDDDFGNKIEAQANIKGFDMEGNARNVLNDLSAADYRIIPIPGDDSATSREDDMKRFTEIMEAVGNSFMKLLEYDPKLLAAFLADWPNRYARETAKFLMENADQMQQAKAQEVEAETAQKKYDRDMRTQVEMAKINAPKVNFKVSPQDIQEAPLGFKMLMAFAQQQNQSSGAPAAQPMQQALPGAAGGAVPMQEQAPAPQIPEGRVA